MDVTASKEKSEQKKTTDRHLENEIPQRGSNKEKSVWMSKKGIAIIIFLIIVFVDPLRWIYSCSDATGVKGFYFEIMREISWLILLFGCFIASGVATAIGYREKSISKKRILLYLVVSCLLLLGAHICTLGFSKYVKDIAFLNQKSYSTTFGEVDRIDRARGRGSWGEQTLYLKGKEKYNIGRYDMSGIRKGDIVYIKYLPASRFALEINK